jgi:hypothetical protein
MNIRSYNYAKIASLKKNLTQLKAILGQNQFIGLLKIVRSARKYSEKDNNLFKFNIFYEL